MASVANAGKHNDSMAAVSLAKVTKTDQFLSYTTPEASSFG